MRTGLAKQEKTTDIWFDEKDLLIHIRTHNTDLSGMMRHTENYVCSMVRQFPQTEKPSMNQV